MPDIMLDAIEKKKKMKKTQMVTSKSLKSNREYNSMWYIQ